MCQKTKQMYADSCLQGLRKPLGAAIFGLTPPHMPMPIISYPGAPTNEARERKNSYSVLFVEEPALKQEHTLFSRMSGKGAF